MFDSEFNSVQMFNSVSIPCPAAVHAERHLIVSSNPSLNSMRTRLSPKPSWPCRTLAAVVMQDLRPPCRLCVLPPKLAGDAIGDSYTLRNIRYCDILLVIAIHYYCDKLVIVIHLVIVRY